MRSEDLASRSLRPSRFKRACCRPPELNRKVAKYAKEPCDEVRGPRSALSAFSAVQTSLLPPTRIEPQSREVRKGTMR